MASIAERLKNFHPIRKIVYFIVGAASYPGLAIINKLKISGTAQLKKLPRSNVLFVSNHQTYFADVITFLHIFCAVKWGKTDRLGIPYYLLNPFTSVYYVILLIMAVWGLLEWIRRANEKHKKIIA